MRPDDCYLVLIDAKRCDPDTHLCRPLLRKQDKPITETPWAAIAHGVKDGAFEIVRRSEVTPDQAREAIAAAQKRLEARKAMWPVIGTSSSFFGLFKKPSLLRASDTAVSGGLDPMDDLTCELMLSPPHLREAAQILRSSEILVAAPKRGWMVAAVGPWLPTCEIEQATKGVHSRAQDQAVCPYIFTARDGVLTSMIANGVTESGGWISIRQGTPDNESWGV
jgi:hypothetical protein